MGYLENGGKWMIKEYKSGEVVEWSKFWAPAQTKPRGKKAAASTARKRDENDRNAIRCLTRIINCNYKHGDMLLTL